MFLLSFVYLWGKFILKSFLSDHFLSFTILFAHSETRTHNRGGVTSTWIAFLWENTQNLILFLKVFPTHFHLRHTSSIPIDTFDSKAILSNSEEFSKILTLGGCPTSHRPQIWRILANVEGCKEIHGLNYYSSLVDHIDPNDQSIVQIKLDLLRTFPGHKFIDTSKGRHVMSRILGAYSLHNPRIGYTQSMNFLAALSYVVVTEEEDAFWVFVELMSAFSSFHIRSMLGVRATQKILETLMDRCYPDLWAHLQTLGVELPLITYPWFLCLFIHAIPPEGVLRIW